MAYLGTIEDSAQNMDSVTSQARSCALSLASAGHPCLAPADPAPLIHKVSAPLPHAAQTCINKQHSMFSARGAQIHEKAVAV